MKRQRVRKPTVGVSLFPFLAVLICTMGALIVLLVMVVQMARVHAAEETQVVDEIESPDAQRMEQESYEWRQQLLDEQRETLTEKLADGRLELSHLEKHIRDLEQRWKQLQAEAADLELRLRGDARDEDAVRAEMDRLRQEIAAAGVRLEEKRAAVARQQPAFAIVPYTGPNGTRRRPIYLECTAEGVVFQPEGIVLREQDFAGLMGPGNPLDAALRAIREYLTETYGRQAGGEPYPLLIVRPDGAEAYALARSAMRAWDDEFGYELVDESMPLEFFQTDPALVQQINKAVKDARSRQAILAAAMPSKFEKEGDVGFVASSGRGGFVPQSEKARQWLTRKGGFGTGDDTRYVDGGRSSQAHEERQLPDVQSVGGPIEDGQSGGVAGAKQGECATPLATARGSNWGLPQSSAGATGIQRPIRLACLPDRFIILPERGEWHTPAVVLIEGDILDEVDTLVGKIWEHIDRWGIAVAGGYWKPVLQVDVAQGGERGLNNWKCCCTTAGSRCEGRASETTTLSR